MKVAFDVDDTLIVPAVAGVFDRDTPNYDTIAIFKWHEAQGHKMIIWSGSGVDWAKTWAEKLGLNAEIRLKQKSEDIDIAYDDCDVDLAKVNIKVKRINNSVSRAEWNKTKRPTNIELDAEESCEYCNRGWVEKEYLAPKTLLEESPRLKGDIDD